MKTIAYALTLSLILLASSSSAASNATINGYVLDKETRQPFSGVRIEVFSFTDHENPVYASLTDSRGFYNASVPAGDTYDVYVRLEKGSLQQQVYVGEGYVQRVDFEVKLAQNTGFIEEVAGSGSLPVAAVALVILAVVVVDQLRIRRRRAIRKQEKQQAEIEKDKTPEIERLKKQRAEMDEMITLTKNKYHKREIDDQSFREIMRDYQKKMIELETKMREEEEKSGELEGLKKQRADIHEMLSMAEKKHQSREIDEESYREIMRDYQTKLIEVEAKLKGLEDAK